MQCQCTLNVTRININIYILIIYDHNSLFEFILLTRFAGLQFRKTSGVIKHEVLVLRTL